MLIITHEISNPLYIYIECIIEGYIFPRSLFWIMLTKTKPAIVATVVVAAAVMAVATLLPLTMAVTPAFAEGQDKETICHRPPGNPDNAHRITVGEPAAEHHLTQHEDDSTTKRCN